MVSIIQVASEIALCAADLLFGFDGAVGVEEQNPYRSAVALEDIVTRALAAVVITPGSDGEIDDAVTV